jgi:hypothetical protein
MKRTVLVFLLGALACAPAAAAKGPHAILTTPRETVEAGRPWEVTVELNEFRRPPVPAMIGRRGPRTVGARMEKTPASMPGAAGFKFTMVFPADGRWKLRMFAGKRRFAFPAVQVGGAAMPRDYVAFPIGSEAAREGAGGIHTTDEAPAVPAVPASAAPTRDSTSGDSDGGMDAWILPLLGVVVAGAGVAAVRRRGWRPAPRPPTGAARPPRRG